MEKETYEPKEEWFHNKNSYKAFMHAVELVQKLKDLQKQGYLLLDDFALLTGECGIMLGFNPPNRNRIPNTLVKRKIMKELGFEINESTSVFAEEFYNRCFD